MSSMAMVKYGETIGVKSISYQREILEDIWKQI